MRDFNKGKFPSMFSALSPEKVREDDNNITTSSGFSSKSRSRQPDLNFQTRSTDSVASVCNIPRPLCDYCGKLHTGECRYKAGTCLRCEPTDHFVRNCPKSLEEKDDRCVKPRLRHKKAGTLVKTTMQE